MYTFCVLYFFVFFTRVSTRRGRGTYFRTKGRAPVYMCGGGYDQEILGERTMKTLKNHQTAKRAPKIRFYRVDYTNTI